LDTVEQSSAGGSSAAARPERSGLRALLRGVRWIAALALGLVGFVLSIGAAKAIRGLLPDAGVGSGLFYAALAAGAAAGAYFLVRPDLRSLSRADVRRWLLTSPLGQAALLYAAATAIMIPLPKFSILPGLLAQSAYAVLAPSSARKARHWWAHAALAVLGFLLLMGALAGTAEALTPRGFGEAGMVFLLPMYGFAILLPVSGIVRLMRGPGAPPRSEGSGGAGR
jgi:hypothetical protein